MEQPLRDNNLDRKVSESSIVESRSRQRDNLMANRMEPCHPEYVGHTARNKVYNGVDRLSIWTQRCLFLHESAQQQGAEGASDQGNPCYAAGAE